MMRRGIMIFDVVEQDWKIWIGQRAYEALQGINFEIRIQNRYYKTCLEQDYNEWIVTLEDDITFSLRLVEVYKVRIQQKDLMPVFDLPF